MSIDRIIFGTMTLGYRGRGARVRDARTAQRMLDDFRKHGYREVDTCYVYGDGSCEQMLGDLNAGEHFELAVRYDPLATPGGHKPEVLRASLRASLDRLDTDRASLLYLNVRGNETPWADTLRAAHDLHEEGLFTELGLSNLSLADVEETLTLTERQGWIRPTVYQGLYNTLSRTAETELLPLLHEHGLRFHAYNPLAGGAFAPAFGNEAAVTAGSRFDPHHAQGAQYRQRYWTEPYLRAVNNLRVTCAELGISPIDAALRWLVHHSRLDGVHGDGIILGASRPEHLTQNLAAVQNGPLPQPVLDAVEAAGEITRPTWPPMSPPQPSGKEGIMTTPNTPRTWFLTGASRGLGAQWAEAILARGDQLVATARTTEALQPLADRYGDRVLLLPLDVTDDTAVRDAVHYAERHFGAIDILVNNAGQMVTGAVEEVTDDLARGQMDVNFFGPLSSTRAVLPSMRERRSGHIIQVSSFGGLVANSTLGIYQASKWALEAMSQSLAAEVAEYNIKVTLIEPLTFPTGLSTTNPQPAQSPAYDHARQALIAGFTDTDISPGDPTATAKALLSLADTPEPPLRVLFGTGGLDILRQEYAERLALWEKWDQLAQLAQGTPQM